MLNQRKQKTMAPSGVKKSKSGTMVHRDQNVAPVPVGKRQGDDLVDQTQKRRAAFGDLTNAFAEKPNLKVTLKKSKLPAPLQPVTGKGTNQKETKTKKKVKPSKTVVEDENDSLSLLSSQGSVMSSSQESNSSSSQESLSSSDSSSETFSLQASPESEEQDSLSGGEVPENVDDVDTENVSDPVQVALYAKGIFQYYKQRELQFLVKPYMSSQRCLTSSMRSILVDWLVEVQENFELNHETLYLAVKLMDIYVSKKEIAKEVLQLVGAAALFIACKFDERCPPLVEDFLYICDDAYKKREFLAMERSVLKTVGFDVGMPLSYRFLRRYAKCCRATMETLTLARYILEMSLMDYDLIHHKESEMASASLLLALKMKKLEGWCSTLEYYTGYQEEEILPIAKKLNTYISSSPKQLTTIKSKYSHKVFFEVAKTPTLNESDFK